MQVITPLKMTCNHIGTKTQLNCPLNSAVYIIGKHDNKAELSRTILAFLHLIYDYIPSVSSMVEDYKNLSWV